MQLQVHLSDLVWVGHVVFLRHPGSPMFAAAVALRYADGRIDYHLRYMNALRHQLARHALGQSSLGLTGHGKGGAFGEAF